MSVKCKLLLYADESVLLVSDKDPRAVSDTLSRELETCNEWLIDHRLSLHPGRGKAAAMLCATKQQEQQRRTWSEVHGHAKSG